MIFIGVIIGLIFGIVVFYWFRVASSFNLGKNDGKKFESLIGKMLNNSFGSSSYHLIENLTIRDKFGSNQIDFVLVSRFGIFVIECKDFLGNIYPNEAEGRWTRKVGVKKSSFHSPLSQNYAHVKALANRTNLNLSTFKPLVVFSNRGKLHTKPENVLNPTELPSYISSFSKEVLPFSHYLRVVGQLYVAREKPSKETDKKHIESLKKRVDRTKNTN